MTLAIITDIENLIAELKNSISVKTVETDVKAAVSASVSYIESQGLTALYNMATSLLTGAATGTPWATLCATLLKQAETAGIAVAKGAEAIVLGQAQVDLIAAGNLVSPTSGTTVAPAATPAAAPVTPAAS